MQSVDRLFFEEKKRVTDIVPVHRRVAPGDPVGRLEETERAPRFPVGFFEEGRRPDAEGGGQGLDGARENGFFIDQMIIRCLADSRALQESVEGQIARAAQLLGVLPGKAHVQMVLFNSTVVKLVLDFFSHIDAPSQISTFSEQGLLDAWLTKNVDDRILHHLTIINISL